MKRRAGRQTEAETGKKESRLGGGGGGGGRGVVERKRRKRGGGGNKERGDKEREGEGRH